MDSKVKVGSKVSRRGGHPLPTLISAAKKGDLDDVAGLIAKGENINQISVGGWTALNMASANGQIDIVELLIENGADHTILTDEKNAMQLAMGRGEWEIVAMLHVSTDLKLNPPCVEDAHVVQRGFFSAYSSNFSNLFSGSPALLKAFPAMEMQLNTLNILSASCLFKLLSHKFILLDFESIYDLFQELMYDLMAPFDEKDLLFVKIETDKIAQTDEIPQNNTPVRKFRGLGKGGMFHASSGRDGSYGALPRLKIFDEGTKTFILGDCDEDEEEGEEGDEEDQVNHVATTGTTREIVPIIVLAAASNGKI